MADTYTNILYHIIFGPKNRQPVITAEIQPRLYEYLGGIIRNHRGVLYEIGGINDHVHMLVRWNTDAIKDLVREMKSDSTKWIHKTFNGHKDFYWQSGGGIFTVSHSMVPRVMAYIRNQALHHQKKSFKEEYIDFLRKNGVEFEEKYLFD
ncbi:IS200/IS605 family transposase [bacterium]|nr:IS200/IS605 family transposase [bacterium]